MWLITSEYLLELDTFVASKVWIFVPVAAVFITIALITLLDVLHQGLQAFVVPHIRQADLRRYGEWAVVTGGTDGIGKAYCRRLAEKGLNIVIISRDNDRLQKTADELVSSYGIKVSTIQADFRKGWDLKEELAERLKEKEIGILVNNVGKAMDIRRSFHLQRDDVIYDLVTINIESLTMMTKIVLPQMLSRRKGAIVAMSSLSGQRSVPMIAVYGASKAAMTALTRALRYEYNTFGIEFQCLIPSCVTTKIGLIKNSAGLPKLFFPDADTYCRYAVPTIGFTSYTTGYLPHSLKWLLIDRRMQDIFMFVFKKFFLKRQLQRG